MRHLLPLIPTPNPHTTRSRMTCRYKCGNACDHPEPNTSGNTHLQELLGTAVARRRVLGGTAAGSAALVVGALTRPGLAAAATGEPRGVVGSLTFEPVAPNKRDNVTVPVGYDYDVLIGWGDRVLPGAPAFDVYAQTPRAQAQQFGYNCDYVGLVPVRGGRRGHFMLAVNHEYTNEELMFPAAAGYTANQKRRIAMMAHGMSFVEIVKGAEGRYRRVPVSEARRNRRITAATPFRVTGPAAGNRRLRTTADPTGRRVLGTLNNCAGGVTPWGTVLSGEENFNQYFEASGALDPRYAESYDRYGVGEEEEGRGWHRADPRFDLTKEPHEPFRFGWVVEIDPSDPTSTPRKHTMLGRLKHETANIALNANGRVVAYTGDDEKGEYFYRFVSDKRYRDGNSAADRAHNMTLLDSGTLYVARFVGRPEDLVPEYDGYIDWRPLTSATESYIDGMSVADVLIDTRFAADLAGGTRMDRPEDVQLNPVNNRVYCCLTNNDLRGVDPDLPVNEANPVGESSVRTALGEPLTRSAGNRNGYVLEVTPRRGDHAAPRSDWALMLVCGDPEAPETYFAGYPSDDVSPISCPDNVAFDGRGNLWISTDGNQLGSNDGLFAVPTAGPRRGRVRQFLTVPIGAETCGPLISGDGKTVFTAVQHPGEVDGSTFEDPASTWPHTTRYPIPSVITTRRVDGARIVP
jgi:secreted PhoX family phosphatase